MSLIVKAPAKKEKQSPYSYTWKTIGENCFELDIEGKIKLRIWQMRGKTVWYIRARIGAQNFYGERYTLESAAKACDQMLYKKFPHVWTVTDARVIISPWKGELTFEEA